MKKVGKYGSGFLTRIKRSAGDVLAYRWYEDGREKKRILGPAIKFKSEHAIRYEFTERNPISKVRQGGKRLGTPTRLDVKQLRALLEALPARERLMVLLDFGTGLRRGELSGVKWLDIDFKEKVLTPMRSIVKQHIGDVKTEASKKQIPLDDDLVAELLAWRKETPYAGDSDYVFASLKMKGKAVLDVQDYAALHQACRCTPRHSTERLAHSSPQLHDVA
jgi:integrase